MLQIDLLILLDYQTSLIIHNCLLPLRAPSNLSTSQEETSFNLVRTSSKLGRTNFKLVKISFTVDSPNIMGNQAHHSKGNQVPSQEIKANQAHSLGVKIREAVSKITRMAQVPIRVVKRNQAPTQRQTHFPQVRGVHSQEVRALDKILQELTQEIKVQLEVLI